MSKKRKQAKKAAHPRGSSGGKQAAAPAAAAADVPGAEEAKAAEKTVWAFPTKSRCPNCGMPQTRCRRTDGVNGVQYRECRHPMCRKRYCVHGTKI